MFHLSRNLLRTTAVKSIPLLFRVPAISLYQSNIREYNTHKNEIASNVFNVCSWDLDTRSVHLEVKKDAGITKAKDLPFFWLRDNCRCSECVNQDTMQRSIDTFSIPLDIHPKSVTILDKGIEINWSHLNHVSFYSTQWLKHQLLTEPHKSSIDSSTQQYLWDASIGENPPSVAYNNVMATEDGVAEWTSKIRQYGFCFIDGSPVSPEATQTLLERISIIRETHYGGFYDFTSDLTMKDTAYTSLALGAHTDTTYFSEPVGLQAFHLLSHTEGTGGNSLLVDGFKAAAILKKENAHAWSILQQHKITWHSSGNEGISIQPHTQFPVIEADELQAYRIRWNNDDRGRLSLDHDVKEWYEAARLWDSILKREENQYWQQLQPGRVLVFDNWRVLHGRSAFTGKRRMCGAYLNRDDFMSRWRNTNFTRKQILQDIL